MAKKKSDPDKVSHKTTSAVPFTGGLFGEVHTVKIEKDGNTYTGTGWDRKAAEKKAGNKYRKGQKD